MSYFNLSKLPVGATAYVQRLHAEGAIRRRLLDIGFTQNTPVSCLYQSPAGDPRAYLIRDAVIALRSEDAKQIEVDCRDN
ncbi:MAG: ferrous iron transport protein A [Clostridia bacterium]|nr:ferrous iron transport protein A [Clostridia bacterium]